MRAATCRLGAGTSRPGAGGSQLRPAVVDHNVQIHDGRLSRPFAASTSGSEGVVEIAIDESAKAKAELVVQLSEADGTLERSTAVVMHVYDRYVLHNLSQLELEWTQPRSKVQIQQQASGEGMDEAEQIALARAEVKYRAIHCLQGHGPPSTGIAQQQQRKGMVVGGCSHCGAVRDGAHSIGVPPSLLLQLVNRY